MKNKNMDWEVVGRINGFQKNKKKSNTLSFKLTIGLNQFKDGRYVGLFVFVHLTQEHLGYL